MRTVNDDEAHSVYQWPVDRGVAFDFGTDPAIELTLDQVLDQCRMYIAAVRIAADFSCDAIGIQYQHGRKEMAPASDLVEGLLNNTERPPVFAEATQTELYPRGPLVHFNEVDECAGVVVDAFAGVVLAPSDVVQRRRRVEAFAACATVAADEEYMAG